MWRPDFKYLRASRASLEGYHRSLCHYSHHYRGTPEKPGLVFALDEGGFCQGIAYEVADDDWNEVHNILHSREILNDNYFEVKRDIKLIDEGIVLALCYVMNRDHEQYAGHLSRKDLIACIKQGKGSMGQCIDYVRATNAKLIELGIEDKELSAIVAAL
jgi:glutathione-specific gamma-glutamylcyclotransferase